ncbi:MAG: TGS domain-containing protein, partial [Candidatus Bipolaricaulia bacterium]
MIIKLPDGGKVEARGGRPLKEILAELDPELMERVVGAKLDGELCDLHLPLPDGAEVELIPIDSEEAREIYRHSLSHVLAQAVKRLIPEAHLGIGPAIADGFYYDFDLPEHLSPEDLERIAAEMERIIREDYPFERLEVSKDEARRVFEERGESYKLELLEEIEDEQVSLYKDGEFIDLCRGPHILRTGQ